MKHLPPSTPSNPFAELSDAWTESWTQPWSAWQTWSRLWGEQWQRWFDALAAVPTPWLPALAEERRKQPEAIDFFLPWLPRADFRMGWQGVDAGRDTVHAMLRAAVPAAGLFGALAYRPAGDEKAIDVQPAAPSAEARPLSLVEPKVETTRAVVPVKRSPRKATTAAKAPAVSKGGSAKRAGGVPVATAVPAPAQAAVVESTEAQRPKAVRRKAVKPATAPTSGQKPEGA